MDNDKNPGVANDEASKVESAYATGDAASEASGRARQASGVVRNLHGQAKDVARGAGEAASNTAKDTMDTGSEYYREASRALVSTVKEQPLGSLLVASAVGFVLALLLNRPAPRHTFRDSYDR
jgi:ElaB/YqjD/DUF883 family membrane-anchored ribosome-binding protein